MSAPHAWDPWGRFVGPVQTTTLRTPVIKPSFSMWRTTNAFADIDISYDVLDIQRFSVQCGVTDDPTYFGHDRGHLMEAAIRDATLAVGETVERHVYATTPGTFVCVHHPETVIGDDLWGRRDTVATVRRDVHLQPEGRPCRTGSGGRQVFRSPWPCAFCHRRTAVDYVRVCDDCNARQLLGNIRVPVGEGWYYLLRCGLTPMALGRRQLGPGALPPLFGGLMLQMVTDGRLP